MLLKLLKFVAIRKCSSLETCKIKKRNKIDNNIQRLGICRFGVEHIRDEYSR